MNRTGVDTGAGAVAARGIMCLCWGVRMRGGAVTVLCAGVGAIRVVLRCKPMGVLTMGHFGPGVAHMQQYQYAMDTEHAGRCGGSEMGNAPSRRAARASYGLRAAIPSTLATAARPQRLNGATFSPPSLS